MERSDMAKRFFIAGWEREREREGGREGGRERERENTETYQCHYCQHSSLFCLLRKGGVVFALASSSWQGEA
jgi:hypothetical protein